MAVPRTWTSGETVTTSIANTHWRDMFIALGAAKGLVIPLGDPGGAVLTVGKKLEFEVPYGVRVTGWTLESDVVGSIVLDLWSTTYALAPTTVANTIAGSEKPTLVAAQKNQDLTLATWITDIPQGNMLAVYVESCTGIHAAWLTLRCSLLDLL